MSQAPTWHRKETKKPPHCFLLCSTNQVRETDSYLKMLCKGTLLFARAPWTKMTRECSWQHDPVSLSAGNICHPKPFTCKSQLGSDSAQTSAILLPGYRSFKRDPISAGVVQTAKVISTSLLSSDKPSSPIHGLSSQLSPFLLLFHYIPKCLKIERFLSAKLP